ncbi:MAG: Holliday junction resolvase RuvX [Gammaproteobacteria bacterium]|nr:Holliday junction resolvase RuvX [Gammaproteobacteria bacterium]
MSATPSPPTKRAEGTLLGLDFSLRHIGVAAASTVTRVANPVTTINNPSGGGVNWDALTALLQQWRPIAVIVGLPLTEDGGEQEETRAARRFGRRLHGRYGVQVYWQDERYTTRLAKDAGKNYHVPRHTNTLDAVAAQIILQSWLDSTAQATANGVQ